LLSLVEELNRGLFQPISTDGPATGKASIRVSEQELREYTRHPCFCGVLREAPVTADDYVGHIVISHEGDRGAVGVGFVIDEETRDLKEDLDIVLVVGINYGQGNAYLSTGVPVIDKTGMRPKLLSAFEAIASNAKCEPDWMLPAEDRSYHLVAVNIFPWITRRSWSAHGFNSIEEALLIHCFSPFDIAQTIGTFIDRTAGEGFRALLFHGANNAVPHFGTVFAKDYEEVLRKEAEVVLCDNLAPGYGSKVSNAVRLCRRHITKVEILTSEDGPDS